MIATLVLIRNHAECRASDVPVVREYDQNVGAEPDELEGWEARRQNEGCIRIAELDQALPGRSDDLIGVQVMDLNRIARPPMPPMSWT